MKKIVSITILLFSFSCPISSIADEWKSCDVYNSFASHREAAITFGKIEKKISFFKKQNYASITIFLDGKSMNPIDLIETGRGRFGDGRLYQGYAVKNNSMIVQEFEEDNTMIITAKGEIDFTMFARCR